MKVTRHRDARLRCGLAQLPLRQAHHRRRHRRLERVRRRLRLAGRRRRHRAAGAARRRPAGRRARAHLRRALLRRRGPAAGGVVAQAHRRHRERAARRQGQGARRARATSCSAARCATASASTGRTARPGASIIRPTTSPPSPTSTASRRSAARCARRGFTRAQDQHLHLRGRRQEPEGLAARASARRSIPSSTSTGTCCATCACISKPCARAPGPTSTCCSTSTSTPRPKAISRSCARSPTSTCSGSRSTPTVPEALGYIRRAEPASDLLVRDAARPARVPALLPRAGDGRGHHRHAVERRVAVDEDRGAGRGARGQRRAAQLLRPPVHHDERALRAPPCRTCASWRPTSTASPGTTSWSPTRPCIENGHLVMPDRPGWGTQPNEEAIRAHPPKAGQPGLLNYGQKK